MSFFYLVYSTVMDKKLRTTIPQTTLHLRGPSYSLVLLPDMAGAINDKIFNCQWIHMSFSQNYKNINISIYILFAVIHTGLRRDIYIIISSQLGDEIDQDQCEIDGELFGY